MRMRQVKIVSRFIYGFNTVDLIHMIAVQSYMSVSNIYWLGTVNSNTVNSKVVTLFKVFKTVVCHITIISC